MKISLFYEFPLPRPWSDDDEHKLFQDGLDEVEAADKAGFSTVWLTEHHFLEEYCHSTAPEIFLAAASQRTKDIRLGFGIMHLPPAVNHPARVAERISTLDLISNGRVEFGTGESSSVGELGGFGIDPADKRTMWEEALEVFRPLQASEAAKIHEGNFDKFEPEIGARLEWGASLTQNELDMLRERGDLFVQRMQELFSRYDFLLLPTAPIARLENGLDHRPARDRVLRYTTPVSVTGLPCLALPNRVGGTQLVASHGADRELLQLAALLRSNDSAQQ